MEMRGILLFFGVFCTFFRLSAQYVTTDATLTPAQLVTDVLIDNPCANASNITSSGSIARFAYTGTDFPFQDGIVLSTGNAASVTGPNTSLLSEGGTGWPGDPDLEAALGVGNSINATLLEFDFTPFASEISFDYVFSSEQYLSNPSSNQCNYTDGFVFLLKEIGSAGPYTNLAVVPGTTTPVRVNTVRGPGTICPEANAEWFDAFNGTDHPTNFNGQTKVLKAMATVTPGVTYHMKLVVADQGNNLYDSAIFLGAGSFEIGKDLGDDRLIATNNPLCPNDTVTLDATEPGTNSYQWYRDEIALPGETNPLYTVTGTGDYRVDITYTASGCVATGRIRMEYAPLLTPVDVTLVQCDIDGNGTATFDLTQAASQIQASDSTITSIQYFESTTDTNPINQPSAYSSVEKVLYAQSANSFGCTKFSQIHLRFTTTALAPLSVQEECDDDSDGKTTFDLTAIAQQITAALPTGYTVAFYESEALAEMLGTPLTSPFTNTIPFSQTIYARVLNGPDCYGTIAVPLAVWVFQPVGFEDEIVAVCAGVPETLRVGPGFSSYTWDTTPPSHAPFIEVSTGGTYTVTVSDTHGCTKTKTFQVTASDAATIDGVTVKDFQGGRNTVTIVASGPGDYEYSLDGGAFVGSAVFTDIPGGAYTAYVRDRKGCGLSTQPFYVLDYPSFFTPNGDGFNDYWTIPYFSFLSGARIYLFDRYGKLLTALSGALPSWDGTYGGRPLPADDYWFSIELANGRNIRGHFALKR